MKLRPKLTLSMFAVSALASVVLALAVYRLVERQLVADVRDRLHDITHVGARAIDLAAYRRLDAQLAATGSDAAAIAAVEASPDYRRLADELGAIRQADPALVKFVYLLAPGADGQPPRFVTDADVPALEAKLARGETLGSGERISHYAEPYDVADIPLLARALAECTTEREPDFVYDDEFAVRSVSAYVPLADGAGAPLRDGAGRCLGVLGVDVTDREMRTALAETTRLELVISIAAVAFALLSSIVLGSVLTRAVVALSAVVQRFGAKDFAARAPKLPRDEVGELGQRFDEMAAMIQQHNEHLEELVAHRTKQLMAEQQVLALREAQLAEAHAEVRDALAPGEGRHTGRTFGRFKLGAVIGRGAMGEVYAATDDTGAPFAVKVLATHLQDNEDAVRRFQREARAIASLSTPNIVRLVDVSPPDAALPYLVMERLEGDDLGDLIKQQPVRELAEVVAIVTAVAAGLETAHRAGVVHRDLKPANVFAARAGGSVTWKVVDFGVSKLVDGDATMTTGNVVGTPGYMAPEQARGDAVDHRADIYALGVMIFRLLTGRPAVMPSDTPAMLLDVCYRMPPRPSGLVGMPADVEAVIAIAIAKEPEARFASARELAAQLAAAAAGALDAETRARADALVQRYAWGEWIAEPSSISPSVTEPGSGGEETAPIRRSSPALASRA